MTTDPPAPDDRCPSLLDWLAGRYPDSPRKRIKDWFAAGRVRLDGVTVTRPQERMPDPGPRLERVGTGDAVRQTDHNARLLGGARLVYIDGSIAVVNKPAGMLSVGSPGRAGTSALHFLAQYLGRGRTPAAEPLPVHRLDEYTSGLLCFALDPAARESLIGQVRSHALERTYLAYVEGRPAARHGTWEHWFLLDADGYQQRPVSADTPGAARAVTHFEVVASLPRPQPDGAAPSVITKLRLRLETGLKHQIRLQAACEGLPLAGDRTYHPAFKAGAAGAPGWHPARQALHAVRLGLRHPVSGEYMSWQANLPADLARFEAALRAAGSSGRRRP